MIIKEYKLGEKIDHQLIMDNFLILVRGKLLHVSNLDSILFDKPSILSLTNNTNNSHEFFIPIENSHIGVIPRNTFTSEDKSHQSNAPAKTITLNTTGINKKNNQEIKLKQSHFNFLKTPNVIPSFKTITDLTINNERSKVLRNEITSHTFRMTCSRILKHILPYFKRYSIDEVTHQDISSFLNYLSTFEYNNVTISQYLVALKKIFVTAKLNDWINDIPYIPKIKVQKKPRGWFTLNEYKTLCKESIRYSSLHELPYPPTHRNIKNGIFTNQQNIMFGLNWVIRFMINSFIRPVDLKIIQHQHVEIIKGKYVYLRLNLPETKRHTGQTITLPGAVFAYQRLVEYYQQFGLNKPKDYLFLPEVSDRQAAITILENNFRKLLINCNLRFSSNGLKRTLYSLRHSAITYRLLYGKKTDLLTLARNSRTSVEMIDKYYASEISAEMKIDHIHS
ncbi:hypothetical protein FERRO_07140 [Ferrovum sp. JA12]|uniref:phage integrase SAM-like domain-containing protein n=1 Tax=Ferrovum sp. JA12 TaxID=1356299 RepID=UPI000702AC9E|nr:phage integrase SAM-like domain-containing protein [Ferrovum sp. JA12]KRH79642.1 hypothetical protein FERRO_07140 [Ferrovum sp. JA12]